MAITNPKELITKQDLADFYEQIKPYLGSYPVAIANKFSKGDIYSTSEKMIGQWQNGKPLYSKTIQVTIPTTSTDGTNATGYYAIGASIESVASLNGVFSVSGTWFEATKEDMNTTSVTATTSTAHKHILMEVSLTVFDNSYTSDTSKKNNLRIQNSKTSYNGLTGYVTVQYTKTTDSAMAIGDETDYSTTEKIVGTWIDSKPIYQKTFTGTLTNTSAIGTETATSVNLGVNIACAIEINGIILTSNGACQQIPAVKANSSAQQLVRCAVMTNSATSNPNTLQIQNAWYTSGTNTYYITLQYTKA